jgi:quinol-cytochrome oxidoreductase complex cytochrome b subunit
VRLAAFGSLLFVVLLASGLYLTFRYRPSSTVAPRGVLLDTTVRVHQVAAYLLLIDALALAVVVVLGTRGHRPLRRRIAAAVAAVAVSLTTVAAIVSGRLLPWDQLALWAVTTGNRVRSIRGVLDFPVVVRFVVIGTSEVDLSTYARTAWVHILVIPLVLVSVAALALVAARARHRGAGGGNDEPTPAANVLG